MRKKRKKKAGTILVPVVSMGDIAFLLIIFFMVISNFSQDVSIKLRPPKAPDMDQVEQAKIIVSIDTEGRYFVKDKQFYQVQAIEYFIAARLKDKKNQKDRTVEFRCDREIPKEVFEPVLEAIAKGGGLIAAVGEESGKRRRVAVRTKKEKEKEKKKKKSNN